jgi:ankyrin repeat protein
MPARLTPLIVAASSGQADEVRSLLDEGASVNTTAADGRTALIAATENNHIEVVQTLINAGADLNLSSRGERLLKSGREKMRPE